MKSEKLEDKLKESKLGGGQKSIDKHHNKGKMTARERVDYLLDKYPVEAIRYYLIMETSWGEDIKFDFIIDDGAHWPEAIHKTFNNIFPFLKEGGKYFIEDMWPLSIMDEKELAHDFIKGQANLYSMPDHEKLMETLSIYNTTHYDRRKETRCTDTYMVVVDKMGL